MGVNKDRIYTIVLVFLVILSFILSYNLWTAGSEISDDQNIGSQSSRIDISTVNHSISDVYRPTIITLHGLDDEHRILMASTFPVRNLLNNRFTLENLEKIEREEQITTHEYVEIIQSGQWVEFSFIEELPLGIYGQKFNELPQGIASEFFDRILINTDNLSSIYFYHTDSDMMYTASVKDDESLNIEPFLNTENLRYRPAQIEVLENDFIYLSQEVVEIPYRSYVLDRLQNSLYTSNFFPDTSLVDVRSSGSITRYIDLTKEVSINQRTNTLVYLRQITDPGEMNSTERYRRSFEQVERFENWAGTFALSNYNREENIISFRREIEGLPVYSPASQESVSEIGLVENGVTHLKLPLRFSTTPITIEDSPIKELQPGVEIMEDLRRVMTFEDLGKIENLMIGFTWEESVEASQVIYFIPDWYVLYDGSWIKFESLLGQYREAAYGF